MPPNEKQKEGRELRNCAAAEDALHHGVHGLACDTRKMRPPMQDYLQRSSLLARCLHALLKDSRPRLSAAVTPRTTLNRWKCERPHTAEEDFPMVWKIAAHTYCVCAAMLGEVVFRTLTRPPESPPSLCKWPPLSFSAWPAQLKSHTTADNGRAR